MSWLASNLGRLFGWRQKSAIVAPMLFTMGQRQNTGLRMETAFEKVSWVQRAVRVKASNAAMVPVEAVRKVGGRGQGRVDLLPDSHPLSKLLARPNAEQDFDSIVESIVTHLELRGEGFLELDAGEIDGKPVPPAAIYSHPPQWLEKVDVDTKAWTYTGFVLSANGQRFSVPGHNGIFFKYYNPANPIRGLAPLSAAYVSADMHYAAQLFTAKFFENGGVPSGVLSLDREVFEGAPDEPTTKRLRAEFRNLYAGLANAHSVMVLGPGMKFDVVGTDAKRIDFSGLMGLSRDEILAVHGVPQIMVGIVTDANRSNSDAQIRMFWENTEIPLLEDVRSLLNRKLAARFGPDVSIRFNYEQVPALRKDMKALGDGIIPFILADVFTVNEARQEYFGKPPVPWGDGPMDDDEDGDEPPPGEAQPKASVTPERARKMLADWKNGALSRIAAGARTPIEAFPAGREAKKAAKRLGISNSAAFQLSRAAYAGLALQWDAQAPADSVAQYFEKEIAALHAEASGAKPGESKSR